MTLEFFQGYWDDENQKAAFKDFMIDIHNLDFDKWDSFGFWDANYHPFSFFRNGKVVSNVCVYSLDMVVGGVSQKVAQISGVGTIPELRRKGLNRELTEKASAWAMSTGHAFFYLFADEGAVPFYRKLGYIPLQEKLPVIDIVPRKTSSHALEKLDISDPKHIDLIYRLAQHRSTISETLGSLSPKLTMFHALYTLSNFLFYSKELDVVLCFKVNESTLRLYDVIGEKIPSLEQIESQIHIGQIKKVECMFCPDKLGVKDVIYVPFPANNLHVSRGHPLATEIIFPFTAHA